MRFVLQIFTDKETLCSHKEQHGFIEQRKSEKSTAKKKQTKTNEAENIKQKPVVCGLNLSACKMVDNIEFGEPKMEQLFVCAHCESIFKTEENLKSHLTRYHPLEGSSEIKLETDDSDDPCNIFTKLNGRQEGKVPHQLSDSFPHQINDQNKIIQRERRRHRYKLCNKSFAEKRSFIAHMSRHSKKSHQSKLCNKLSGERSFNAHMLIHRSKQNYMKSFQCKISKKSCISSQQLNKRTEGKGHRSLLVRGKFPSNILKKNIKTGEEKKLHKCDQCGKERIRKHRLTAHVRTHSAEKSHHCDQYDKTFTQKCNLTQYLRIHSGKRPYRCELCDKTFTQKVHLTEHLKVHSGEKPFRCDQCNKAFAQKSNLVVHLRTHSGEKPFKCDQCNKAFCT